MKSMDRVFEIRIELKDTVPIVWRELVVPETLTFYEFHHAIQISFGWENYHLYSFDAKGQSYGNLDLLEDVDTINDKSIFINQLLQKEQDTINYEYDFGDGWVHNIELKKIKPHTSKVNLPIVIDGAKASPPEDCGGVHGFENLKNVMKNPKDLEYKELVRWLGKPFDPNEFNIQHINEDLKKLKKHIAEYESED